MILFEKESKKKNASDCVKSTTFFFAETVASTVSKNMSDIF